MGTVRFTPDEEESKVRFTPDIESSKVRFTADETPKQTPKGFVGNKAVPKNNIAQKEQVKPNSPTIQNKSVPQKPSYTEKFGDKSSSDQLYSGRPLKDLYLARQKVLANKNITHDQRVKALKNLQRQIDYKSKNLSKEDLYGKTDFKLEQQKKDATIQKIKSNKNLSKEQKIAGIKAATRRYSSLISEDAKNDVKTEALQKINEAEEKRMAHPYLGALNEMVNPYRASAQRRWEHELETGNPNWTNDEGTRDWGGTTVGGVTSVSKLLGDAAMLAAPLAKPIAALEGAGAKVSSLGAEAIGNAQNAVNASKLGTFLAPTAQKATQPIGKLASWVGSNPEIAQNILNQVINSGKNAVYGGMNLANLGLAGGISDLAAGATPQDYFANTAKMAALGSIAGGLSPFVLNNLGGIQNEILRDAITPVVDTSIFSGADLALDRAQGINDTTFADKFMEMSPFMIPGYAKMGYKGLSGRYGGSNKVKALEDALLGKQIGDGRAQTLLANAVGEQLRGKAGKVQDLNNLMMEFEGSPQDNFTGEMRDNVNVSSQFNNKQTKALESLLYGGEKLFDFTTDNLTKEEPSSYADFIFGKKKPSENASETFNNQTDNFTQETNTDSPVGTEMPYKKPTNDTNEFTDFKDWLDQANAKSKEIFGKDYSDLNYDEKVKIAEELNGGIKQEKEFIPEENAAVNENISKTKIEERIKELEKALEENSEWFPEENHSEPIDWDKYQKDQSELLGLRKKLKTYNSYIGGKQQGTQEKSYARDLANSEKLFLRRVKRDYPSIPKKELKRISKEYGDFTNAEEFYEGGKDFFETTSFDEFMKQKHPEYKKASANKFIPDETSTIPKPDVNNIKNPVEKDKTINYDEPRTSYKITSKGKVDNSYNWKRFIDKGYKKYSKTGLAIQKNGIENYLKQEMLKRGAGTGKAAQRYYDDLADKIETVKNPTERQAMFDELNRAADEYMAYGKSEINKRGILSQQEQNMSQTTSQQPQAKQNYDPKVYGTEKDNPYIKIVKDGENPPTLAQMDADAKTISAFLKNKTKFVDKLKTSMARVLKHGDTHLFENLPDEAKAEINKFDYNDVRFETNSNEDVPFFHVGDDGKAVVVIRNDKVDAEHEMVHAYQNKTKAWNNVDVRLSKMAVDYIKKNPFKIEKDIKDFPEQISSFIEGFYNDLRNLGIDSDAEYSRNEYKIRNSNDIRYKNIKAKRDILYLVSPRELHADLATMSDNGGPIFTAFDDFIPFWENNAKELLEEFDNGSFLNNTDNLKKYEMDGIEFLRYHINGKTRGLIKNGTTEKEGSSSPKIGERTISERGDGRRGRLDETKKEILSKQSEQLPDSRRTTSFDRENFKEQGTVDEQAKSMFEDIGEAKNTTIDIDSIVKPDGVFYPEEKTEAINKDIKKVKTMMGNDLMEASRSTEKALIKTGILTKEWAENRKRQLGISKEGVFVPQKGVKDSTIDSALNPEKDYEGRRKTKKGWFGKGNYKKKDLIASDMVKNIYSHYVKAKLHEKIMGTIMDEFALPLEEGAGAKNGYVAVNKKLLSNLIFAKGSDKLYKLIDSGEAEIKMAFKDEKQREFMLDLYHNTRGADIQIPKAIYDRVLTGFGENARECFERYGGSKYSWGKLASGLVDFYHDCFRRSVLGTVAFWAHNRVGNYALIAANRDNPLAVISDLAKAHKISDLDISPKLIGNAFAETARGSVKRRAYTGFNAFDTSLNFLGGEYLDTKYLKKVLEFEDKKGNAKYKANPNYSPAKLYGAKIANMLVFPAHVYRKFAEKALDYNSSWENYERKVATMPHVEKVRKDLIKLTGQQAVTVQQAMRYIKYRPALEEAVVRQVEDVLGNYRTFSPGEKAVLKQVMPFGSWKRTVLRTCWQLAKKNPTRYFLILKELKRLHDDDDDYKEYQKGSLKTGITDSRSGRPLISNLLDYLPFNDFTRWGDNPINDFSPLISKPIEAAAGGKFFGSDEKFKPKGKIYSKRYVDASKWDKNKHKYVNYYVDTKPDKEGKYKEYEKLPIGERAKYLGVQLGKSVVMPWEQNNMTKDIIPALFDKNTYKRGFKLPDRSYDTNIGGYYDKDMVDGFERENWYNKGEKVKWLNRASGLGLNIKHDLNIKEQEEAEDRKLKKLVEKIERQQKKMKERHKS